MSKHNSIFTVDLRGDDNYVIYEAKISLQFKSTFQMTIGICNI